MSPSCASPARRFASLAHARGRRACQADTRPAQLCGSAWRRALARAVLLAGPMTKLLLALSLALATAPLASLARADQAPAAPAGPRFVPTVRDGKPIGVKVYAIRPGTRLADQKFENGDLLLRVDGESVVTEKGGVLLRDSVLEGKADAVVELERRGQPMKLTTTKAPR